MSLINIRIDGVSFEAEAGAPLIKSLIAAGHKVPHLCHDPRLQPAGACRMCVVEVAGEPRPVASCAAIATDGMVVQTQSPALDALRRTNLELIAARYPAEAVAAEPEHPFHRLLRDCDVQAGGGRQHAIFSDDSHPYIGVAMDRCIQCLCCVRICDELQGQSVWQAFGRGAQTHIAPARGATLLEGGCVSCGACVDTCPTEALYDKQSPTHAEQWTRTTCVYCGVGCQMEVGTREGHVTQIKPAMHPVNHGHLCVKGRYAWQFSTAPDRVASPMIRRSGAWQKVSWDEALNFTADRLRDIRDRHGADSIGVLGSARATNEENYLVQKFARVILGTNNVDCCARVCHLPSAKALKTMLGTGAATNAFEDIEQAGAFLICGCNPTENHPIVGARIKQAVMKGAKLVVIDPRRIELAQYADLHLALRPGTNVPLFNAMAATILDENLADPEFLRHRVTGLEEFRPFTQRYAPEKVAEICGVPAAQIRAAARLYAGARPAMCFHGLGATEHLQGTEGVMALINLALLTGNLGRTGAGINPLRGQNNVQGSAQMGCEPNTLTGAQSIADPAVRARFESAWETPLPASHGLDLMAMMDAAQEGHFKALWAFGYDVYLSLANEARTGAAMRNLELVIVQDLFMNETAKTFGHVFLPAASFLERDGTFMNSDRRVQRIRTIVEPPGEARPDGWIIQELARRLGHSEGFSFSDAESVWNEVRSVWPAGAGLSYSRLENESLHWPCLDEKHPGTPVLHTGHFASGPTASLRCIEFVPTSEQCSKEFPLLLNSGRTLYHFNTGTMTGRTSNITLQAQDLLDIHPADAARLGLAANERVRVISRYGQTVLAMRITDTVNPGELFTSFHSAELFVNRLTSSVRDRRVGSPEYKITAVRLEKLA